MAYVKGQDLQKLICEVIFQGVTANLPAQFYVGMGSGSLPLSTDTLATVVASEVSGGGYARKLLTRNTTDFPTLAVVSDAWKVSSKLLSWVAAGDYTGNSDWVFLTDVLSGSSGKFYGAVSIADPFRLLGTDTFDDTFEYQDR